MPVDGSICGIGVRRLMSDNVISYRVDHRKGEECLLSIIETTCSNTSLAPGKPSLVIGVNGFGTSLALLEPSSSAPVSSHHIVFHSVPPSVLSSL